MYQLKAYSLSHRSSSAYNLLSSNSIYLSNLGGTRRSRLLKLLRQGAMIISSMVGASHLLVTIGDTEEWEAEEH